MNPVSDAELIRKAAEVAKPWRLSKAVEAAGVGCALVTDKGNVYLGVCIDTSSSAGFCAEHVAMGNMVTNGESRIASIVAVNWAGTVYPPCGICRELIYQMDDGNSETRVILNDGKVKSIKELLPDHWLEFSEMSGKESI